MSARHFWAAFDFALLVVGAVLIGLEQGWATGFGVGLIGLVAGGGTVRR